MASIPRLLALILLACGLAACSIGQRAAGPQAASCGNIPTGACEEQLEQVGLRHPGAVRIDIECGPVPCTRASGAGTATITRADGTTVREPWAYAGDPGPMPVPVCIGSAPESCRAIGERVLEDVRPSKHVVGIAIRCRVARCDENKGDAEITMTLADGTSEVTGHAWDGGAP